MPHQVPRHAYTQTRLNHTCAHVNPHIHTHAHTCMHAHAHAMVWCPPGTGTSHTHTAPHSLGEPPGCRHRPGRSSRACSPNAQPSPAQSCSPVIWSEKLTSEGRWPTWPELHLEAGLADKLVQRRARRGKQEGGPEGRFQIRFSAHRACALQGSQL